MTPIFSACPISSYLTSSPPTLSSFSGSIVLLTLPLRLSFHGITPPSLPFLTKDLTRLAQKLDGPLPLSQQLRSQFVTAILHIYILINYSQWITAQRRPLPQKVIVTSLSRSEYTPSVSANMAAKANTYARNAIIPFSKSWKELEGGMGFGPIDTCKNGSEVTSAKCITR